jgi:hypothetical protein
MFGNHYPNTRAEFYDDNTMFVANTVLAFVDMATEFVKNWQQSWLDVTGYGLSTETFGFLPPTIVLVQRPVIDLSLFWNLRIESEANVPAWIIPIPIEATTDTAIFERLKNWLLAFLPYGRHPNYCNVTSLSVEQDACGTFCENFQQSLSGTPIEFVDYQPPRNRVPFVIPYEYESSWPVEINHGKLTIQAPGPKVFEELYTSEEWFVDLRKDVKTGRTVAELQLPSSPVVSEILNGPCPPSFYHAIIPRTGDGVDSINLCCSKRNEVINIYLPTSEEILGEILREFGAEPVTDEKRSSYLPVINRFGGIFAAAAALSGQRRTILTTLANSTKTIAEIKGACGLGAGELAGRSYVQWIEPILQNKGPRSRRIAQRRFAEDARRATPEDMKPQTILEHWADREIVERQWRIGPCGRCGQTYFIPNLNIQRRVICTNCGRRISLPHNVPIGYTLHRAVRHAINEGIIPVVLTGRFPHNMTHEGFFWLPGVKYRIDDKSGDIDVLACCDGQLVFCECKTLDHTPEDSPLWNSITEQFLETAALAIKCGGNLAVLAAQVNVFPQTVVDKITQALGNAIPILLLNKNDLDTGHRDIPFQGQTKWLKLDDLIPPPFPESPRKRTDKPRSVRMGFGTYTS